jgi:hypothetical protein
MQDPVTPEIDCTILDGKRLKAIAAMLDDDVQIMIAMHGDEPCHVMMKNINIVPSDDDEMDVVIEISYEPFPSSTMMK